MEGGGGQPVRGSRVAGVALRSPTYFSGVAWHVKKSIKEGCVQKYMLETCWEELDPLLAAADVVVGGWSGKGEATPEVTELLSEIASRLGMAKLFLSGHFFRHRHNLVGASENEREGQTESLLRQ